MANSFFQFKQFYVHHDKCAMKVGTDGVLLGAWVDINNSINTLDIGTGSGLISLMLAQRNPDLQIDAIDIDADAIIQTKENVINSPFSHNISSKQIPLQDLKYDKQYDLIVSNPPYFEKSLKPENKSRSLARHTDSLPMDELIGISAKLLKPKGRVALIYPHDEKNNLLNIARSYKLFTSRITHVFPTPQSKAKRILIEFAKEEQSLVENNLTIEIARHQYSEEFVKLVKDFYLKM